jgi:predicted transcriptional regulator
MAKSFDTLKNKLSSERRAKIDKKIEETLQEMPLAELRQARQFTQEQLARSMKIKQASISKMEGQTDMYISTLRKYIKAMGGELEIVAKFPEGKITIKRFESL